MGRSLGFVCRERQSLKGLWQGSDRENLCLISVMWRAEGNVKARGPVVGGDHCLAHSVPGPSSVQGRVPSQGKP